MNITLHAAPPCFHIEQTPPLSLWFEATNIAVRYEGMRNVKLCNMRDGSKERLKEVIKRSATFPKMKAPPHHHHPPDLWVSATESVVWGREREWEWVVCHWVRALLSLQTARIYIFLMAAVSTGCCKSRRGFNLQEPAGVNAEGSGHCCLALGRSKMDALENNMHQSEGFLGHVWLTVATLYVVCSVSVETVEKNRNEFNFYCSLLDADSFTGSQKPRMKSKKLLLSLWPRLFHIHEQ